MRFTYTTPTLSSEEFGEFASGESSEVKNFKYNDPFADDGYGDKYGYHDDESDPEEDDYYPN